MSVQCGSRHPVKRNAAPNRFLPENSASKKPQKVARFSKLNRCPSNVTGQAVSWCNLASFHPEDLPKSRADLQNPVIRVTRGPVGAVLVLHSRKVQFVCEDREQVFVHFEVKLSISERLQPP